MSKILIDSILIPYTNLMRTLRIYLPTGYDDSVESFPVIYMHDAQNLFDVKTSSYGHIWDIKTFLDRHYEQTKDKFIVVGIDNYEGGFNRLDEYSPWVNSSLKTSELTPEITEDVGGLGVKYIDFLVNKLKPYIDNNFKTKPEREFTSIIGSSMGGLISLYAGLNYPEIFSKVGAFSTAVWFAKNEILEQTSNYKPNLVTKWYLDIGTNETSNDEVDEFNSLYLGGTIEIFEAFKKIGVSEENILLVVDKGGIHNEKYWAKRFPNAFNFLQ